MKKGIKITLIIFGILLIGFFLFRSINYFNYKNSLTSQSVEGTLSRFVNGVEEENVEYTDNYEDFETRGSSNPALRFRNKTSGDVVYYFDHTGKIIAYNITLEENLYATKNMSAGEYGFFKYLGSLGNLITKGSFTDVNSSTINAVNLIGEGSRLTNLTISSDAFYRVYDTGWLAINGNDWTNVHLGSDNSTKISNVTHNLGAPLSNLSVQVLISTDGTDANSFEVEGTNTEYTGVWATYGVTIYQVDFNTIQVQTGASGIDYLNPGGAREAIDDETHYYKIKVSQIIRLNTSAIMGGVPANTISAFYQEDCPIGWILADGNSGTPDLQGIFIRGAGTSTSYKMANGTYFSATYGEYQNDSFQGHFHAFKFSDLGATNYGVYPRPSNLNLGYSSQEQNVREPNTDGTNGPPRTGAETRPASFGLIYCMKTTEDSATSNTIFQESGGVVTTADSGDVVRAKRQSYNTGWLDNDMGTGTAADWTNVHLGDDPTDPTDYVTHNLNAPLSDILVKVLISENGGDADSFETIFVDYRNPTAGAATNGITIFAVDNNNIKVQTGEVGVGMVGDADGVIVYIDTDDWYYKIKVWYLG